MKKLVIISLAILFFTPCVVTAQTKTSKKAKTTQTYKRKATKKKNTQAGLTPLERKVVGKHMLSLQWISWDYFGTAEITKGTDGVYYCKGEQLSRGDDSHIGDYLKIDGTIRIISELELEFTGTIRTKIYHINNGDEVVREGTFTFLSTQGRKYWRMQDMINPADGCTDYVDIYFKR